MIYGFYPKQKAYVIKEPVPGHYTRTHERDFKQEEEWHKLLLDAGFEYNEEYDFYYSDEGALMSETMEPIENLIKSQKYSECIPRGYEMSYGKPTPLGQRFMGSSRAIYCTNYKQIIDNLKESNNQVKER